MSCDEHRDQTNKIISSGGETQTEEEKLGQTEQTLASSEVCTKNTVMGFTVDNNTSNRSLQEDHPLKKHFWTLRKWDKANTSLVELVQRSVK